MDVLKKIIGILCIAIFAIFIVLGVYMYYLNGNNRQQDSNTVSDVKIVVEGVKNPTNFFAIEGYIQKDIDESFVALEMNVLGADWVDSYGVRGEITISGETKEVYFIFRLDLVQYTYLIEEVEGNYSNLNQIDLYTDLEEIESNGYNYYEPTTINDKTMCKIYLEHFTSLELSNPEQAYELLDTKYSKKKFRKFRKIFRICN